MYCARVRMVVLSEEGIEEGGEVWVTERPWSWRVGW